MDVRSDRVIALRELRRISADILDRDAVVEQLIQRLQWEVR